MKRPHEKEGVMPVSWAVPVACVATAAVAVIAALLLPGSARADFAFSPPVTLAEPAAFAPDLAADPQGRTTIVWQEMAADEATRLIRAIRLGPDGTLGPVRTLTAMSSGPSCSCPQIVIDSQGRATVAWVAGVDPSDRDRIQIARLDADGVPLGPVETLSAPHEVASHHDLAVDSQGRATVVWRVGESLVDPPNRIESARLLPNGITEPAQTISDPAVASTTPAIAIDGADRAVIAWDATDGMQLVRISAAGLPGAVQTVLPPEASAAIPQILVDSENRATIAYWRSDGFQSKAVRVEPTGTVSPILDLSNEGEQTLEPRIAMDSAGRVTAVWEDFSNNIKTTRIEANGMVGPVRLVSGPEPQRGGDPQVAITPDDQAVVVWAHSPPTFIEPEPAPECEVGFDPEGDVVQAAFVGVDGVPGPVQRVSRLGEQAILPAVAVGPLGDIAVTWHSFDGTYFCSDVEVRLQMSWGPWSPSVIDEEVPDETDPEVKPKGSDSSPPAVTLRLGRRAVARNDFVAVRGICIGPTGATCAGTIKLLSLKKKLLAFGRVRLAVGVRRTLRLRLSRHGRQLLARRDPRILRATVQGIAIESGGLTISSKPLPNMKRKRRP